MKNQLILRVLVCFSVLMASRPAAAAFVVMEQAATAPHQKIGELEVSSDAPCSLGWKSLRVLTFGLVKGPDRADRIKDRLKDKLRKMGKKYKSDAITEVKYYPDPATETFFRTGSYYARGTLIKYEKFPQAPAAKSQA